MPISEKKTPEPACARDDSEHTEFNMVAERAFRSTGHSESEREGSKHEDLSEKQQPGNSEQELRKQRFRKVRRTGSREIEIKFDDPTLARLQKYVQALRIWLVS